MAELGRATMAAYESDNDVPSSDMISIINRIKAFDGEIASLESEKDNMIADHKKQRRNNIDSI